MTPTVASRTASTLSSSSLWSHTTGPWLICVRLHGMRCAYHKNKRTGMPFIYLFIPSRLRSGSPPHGSYTQPQMCIALVCMQMVGGSERGGSFLVWQPCITKIKLHPPPRLKSNLQLYVWTKGISLQITFVFDVLQTQTRLSSTYLCRLSSLFSTTLLWIGKAYTLVSFIIIFYVVSPACYDRKKRRNGSLYVLVLGNVIFVTQGWVWREWWVWDVDL